MHTQELNLLAPEPIDIVALAQAFAALKVAGVVLTLQPHLLRVAEQPFAQRQWQLVPYSPLSLFYQAFAACL